MPLGSAPPRESQGVPRPAETRIASSLLDHPLGNTSPGRRPNQISAPPQPAPLKVQEQQLYSEPFHHYSSPHPWHPVEKNHFGCLNPWSHYCVHYAELVTWDDGRNHVRLLQQLHCCRRLNSPSVFSRSLNSPTWGSNSSPTWSLDSGSRSWSQILRYLFSMSQI